LHAVGVYSDLSGCFDDVNNNKPSPTLARLALALAVSAVPSTARPQRPQPSRSRPSRWAALKQLGQQTNLQLFFSPELVAGKQAPAVSGNLAPEQALQQLLQGSGLTFEMSGRHRGGEASADTLDLGSGSLELAPTDIKVVGDWLGDAQQSVVQNHPGARTVVRREAMVEQGAMNVRDVLRGIPGVQVQDSNGTGGSDLSLNVGVRGLTRACRRAPRC
jgi:Fe(3+) dicitrate transport protein